MNRKASRSHENPLERPLTLTVEEAAEALGVSRGLAYEAVRQGEIPSIRVGRRILVPRHALTAMLAAVAPQAPTSDMKR